MSGKPETIETTSFAQRGPNEERLAVWLLSNTLKQETSADLHWDRESHYLYFRATDNLQVSYYQHLALEFQFIERNSAVLGQVRMWANYLRGEDTLLGTSQGILRFGDLVTFATEYGIDDDSWRLNETDAATCASGELTLFDEEL